MINVIDMFEVVGGGGGNVVQQQKSFWCIFLLKIMTVAGITNPVL